MAFSARKSTVFSARKSSAYKQSGFGSSSTSRSQPAFQGDIFPLLDFAEISVCLRGCEFSVAEEMLVKPTAIFVQQLYEQMVASFLGVTYENCVPILEVCSEGRETFESARAARSVLALVRASLMRICGVDDLSMADFMRPEPQRLRRLLSAVVNFARFREEHMGVCEDLIQRSEETSLATERAYQDVLMFSERVHELRIQKEEEAPKIKETQEHNRQVEAELRRLKKVQEQYVAEHEAYKRDKQRLVSKLEDQNFLTVQMRKECEKLRPYVLDAPSTLRRINDEMSDSVQTGKTSIEKLEKRLRALEVTIESFKTLEQDISACFKIMEETENELAKQDEASRQLARLMELHDQRQIEVHEVERKSTQLKRQLANAEERIQRLQEQRLQKREGVQKKTQELKEAYAALVAERSVVTQEMEKKKALIANVEKKQLDLREQLEGEIRSTTSELQKLEAHVSLYLSEMEQCITAK
ncbi:Nuf2 family-domain-containing protein [Lipomyces tetrasporus]|uniref:Nuf2 family-domain-containing protein n=1 Tax=Lipomyces tetrasporus TaxID=54092 RepID=A0AAD7VRQ5_9ASCO|nr:Nuf2 family-domain-containing protein [Lipomyces tetrasporus]KAJ8098365.1 Nuf2 family-domain-containing protein [Lipomyces tetrasporus]